MPTEAVRTWNRRRRRGCRPGRGGPSSVLRGVMARRGTLAAGAVATGKLAVTFNYDSNESILVAIGISWMKDTQWQSTFSRLATITRIGDARPDLRAAVGIDVHGQQTTGAQGHAGCGSATASSMYWCNVNGRMGRWMKYASRRKLGTCIRHPKQLGTEASETAADRMTQQTELGLGSLCGAHPIASDVHFSLMRDPLIFRTSAFRLCIRTCVRRCSRGHSSLRAIRHCGRQSWAGGFAKTERPGFSISWACSLRRQRV